MLLVRSYGGTWGTVATGDAVGFVGMRDFGGTVPLGGTVAFWGTVDFAVRRSELGALMGVLTLGGSSDGCVGSTTNWKKLITVAV